MNCGPECLFEDIEIYIGIVQSMPPDPDPGEEYCIQECEDENDTEIAIPADLLPDRGYDVRHGIIPDISRNDIKNYAQIGIRIRVVGVTGRHDRPLHYLGFGRTPIHVISIT